MSSNSSASLIGAVNIKVVYITSKHQTGEYSELKDIANQIAQIFYNQPNYDKCLGISQNVYKKNKNFDKKIFKVILPQRKILKDKCLNKKNKTLGVKCGCSACSINNKCKQVNWQCTKIRSDIVNMIRHISNYGIDIS